MHLRAWKSLSVVSACVAMIGFGALPAAAQTVGWTGGPGAAADVTDYTGFIDTPSSGGTVPTASPFQIDGWFVDKTAQGWAGADDAQVFLGQMGNGGTMIAKGIVGENRPDVGGALGNPYWSASGFAVNVPAAAVPAGTQTLNVYLHTPAKGWWTEPLMVSASATAPGVVSAPVPTGTVSSSVATGAPQVTITDPTESQEISTRNGDHTITGTATTPGAGPSDIDRVEVWINGERDTGTQLGTATPASDGSWSVTFTPTHFASTHTNIYVFAHSKSTGRETEVVRGFNITDR
jgi:hypothetical protein